MLFFIGQWSQASVLEQLLQPSDAYSHFPCLSEGTKVTDLWILWLPCGSQAQIVQDLSHPSKGSLAVTLTAAQGVGEGCLGHFLPSCVLTPQERVISAIMGCKFMP